MKKKKLTIKEIITNTEECAVFIYFNNDKIQRLDVPNFDTITMEEIMKILQMSEDCDKIKIK